MELGYGKDDGDLFHRLGIQKAFMGKDSEDLAFLEILEDDIVIVEENVVIVKQKRGDCKSKVQRLLHNLINCK